MVKHNYRELEVWKRSRELVKEIYKLVAQFPASELYGLSQQMRRSAISVPSNIAEGSAYCSEKNFGRHLSISLGSLYELETQVLLGVDLKLISEKHAEPLAEQIIVLQRMVAKLRQKILSNDI
jgi:four helix bundle protein